MILTTRKYVFLSMRLSIRKSLSILNFFVNQLGLNWLNLEEKPSKINDFQLARLWLPLTLFLMLKETNA